MQVGHGKVHTLYMAVARFQFREVCQFAYSLKNHLRQLHGFPAPGSGLEVTQPSASCDFAPDLLSLDYALHVELRLERKEP